MVQSGCAPSDVARTTSAHCHQSAGAITKRYEFDDYHETIGFVNALAWLANSEDHHPDLAVSYNRCVVTWSTHDAGGVTENDVICAAKTDRAFAR